MLSDVSLKRVAALEPNDALTVLEATTQGLPTIAVAERRGLYGSNITASHAIETWSKRLGRSLSDPFSALLVVLGIVSYFTGDPRAAFIIVVMVVLSVLMRVVQEARSDVAARRLSSLVRTMALVTRQGKAQEVPMADLVPGDIVTLEAGDLVPADVRLITSKDLFVNQATLTGEPLPVEKHASAVVTVDGDLLSYANCCFLGTAVESGMATALVVATGSRTQLGAVAKSLIGTRPPTAFDLGLSKLTWLMLRMIAIMVPLVFIINGLTKGSWLEALLFAVAVAVGLTPELLPVIITVNLTQGSLDMSKKKVIVKHLNAIENFGAIDILCTDKTGTLTEGRVALIRHINILGEEDESVLEYGALNSYYHTGLKNMLDDAVLEAAKKLARPIAEGYKKIDEVAFDFARRRMSMVVHHEKEKYDLLICKGAVEEVMARCRQVMIGGQEMTLAALHHAHKDNLVQKLGNDGFRLLALAIRRVPKAKPRYSADDEKDMVLVGFLAFFDPPKATAKEAIKELEQAGLTIKILTGDNDLATRHACASVGLPVESVLLGSDIDKLSDEDLTAQAEKVTIFDKLEPRHKERIILALKRGGHAVGFMGDGINDAPALRAADVGISVNTAVDIAKESSDIILLEQSLLVLRDGVREGRRVFANITKYVMMAASSNFGNMFSVVGASALLPFLPMKPLQVLTNNLLYDFSQGAIPTDNVDGDELNSPRRWQMKTLMSSILILGPVSSVFDFITFGVLAWGLGGLASPAIFQTGWFVESLVSQSLIVHVIRTRRLPFLQSRSSWPVLFSSLAVTAMAVYLPFSPIAAGLGFVALPVLFWPILVVIVCGYLLTAELTKYIFMPRSA